MYLVKDTRSSFFALGNRLENLFIMDIKEKKRRGRGEGEREKRGSFVRSSNIIRNKINIAKEIIKKKQRNDKTILPSNYAQMKKGKGRGEGEKTMEQTHLSFMNFSKLLSTLALPALYRTSFLFFIFFFFLSSIRKKESV